MVARVINFTGTRINAHLSEALDAVDLLEAALVQSLGERAPTGLEIAPLATAENLRCKHKRDLPVPSAPDNARPD